MTQPSSKRFVMEDGYLANKGATDTAIYDEQIARQEGDDATLISANAHTDSEINTLNTDLGGKRPLPNYLINGAFDIWQRGTSLTLLTASMQSGYIADRWKSYATGTTGASYTFSRIENTSRIPGDLGRYDMQITQNNTVVDPAHFGSIVQVIETSDLFPIIGREVGFSGYINSNINTSIEISIVGADAVDSSSPTTIQTFTASVVAGQWTQFSLSSLGISWTKLTVGVQIKVNLQNAGDYIKVSRIKLEQASAVNYEPTAFIRNGANVAAELATCQRYYYRTPSPSVGYPWANGYNTTTLLSTFFVQFPVPMRVAPSALEQSGTAAHFAITNTVGAAVACSAVPTHVSASTRGARIATTVATAGTAGFGSMLLANNTAAYLGWSAEIL
jgi:hypothetical protein